MAIERLNNIVFIMDSRVPMKKNEKFRGTIKSLLQSEKSLVHDRNRREGEVGDLGRSPSMQF